MSTNSKSPLLIVIFIAIILFITAIIWKYTRVDNSENIYITPPVIKIAAPKKETIIIEDTYNINHDYNDDPVTSENVEEKIKELEVTLNMHIMLNSPEEIIKVIEKFKSSGDEQQAEKYIQFLSEKFPDYHY